ncbi:MAG: 2-amino-4-hydroxy-6-hydroxymethyldihydropteridine diphosphokinase [Candidatus Omnitrophica bacterium]|nr:2-amino-4-hydroxy-6-hydroxymethyldihydropteridine diphosphokinase [Candidatus Omnitrophota bacterium]
MPQIFLALGSNVGKKKANLEQALRLLVRHKVIANIKRSTFYTTKPVGGPPQDDYLNGVIKAKTTLSPLKLLKALKNIEIEMGRKKAGKNYPRVIDIDILLYDNRVMRTKKLTIPHPRMHKRVFVLKGLAEIAPAIMHPVIGKTMSELLNYNTND